MNKIELSMQKYSEADEVFDFLLHDLYIAQLFITFFSVTCVK